MLNAGGLLFDAAGRIRCTLSAPTAINGSLVTNTGLLCISSAAGVSGPNGFLFNPNISVDNAGAPAVYLGGLGFTAAGRLCTETAGTLPVSWVEGIPLGVTGRVVLAFTETPVALRAFSPAFAPAFN